ncbi:Heat shock 70 kDa protein 12A [Entomortierella beljakovae]|nr:Heat shock 70 kDa protein 12A [Entomortierella beljakovae]
MARARFDPDDYPIIVAIDFGTTFSPRQNVQYAKTPTLSLYEKVNGKYKMVDWGWKSKLKMETPAASKYTQLSKFKLYLDESADLAPWHNKVDVSTAIADYLRTMHEYVAEKILGQFGPSFSRRSFRYSLTVPAIWSDKAKDIMRKAAVKAELISESDHHDRLMLVSEPEAAALYCEKACKQYDLKHNDQFMICDAGGGTVDLIVYKIDTTNGGRQLSEVTKGHGASCGSAFIDLNLGNMLTKKFGRHASSFPSSIIPTLVDTFAYQLKPHFDGEEDQYLALPRSDCFDAIDNPGLIGIDGGFMCLKATELKEKVFEPVVKQVLKLIDQQLKGAQQCSAIFMVGGFGSSSYLLDRVKQEFKSRVRTISSPYKPEIAVVAGAVYASLTPKVVTARITRRCYGTDVFLPYEAGVDPPDYKYERVDGVFCRNRFSQFVAKEQKVLVDECVTRSYYFTKTGEGMTFSTGIFSYDGSPHPRYVTDSGNSRMGTLRIPNPFKPSDPVGHKIYYVTKMYFGLSEIKVEVEIEGSSYSTAIKFE